MASRDEKLHGKSFEVASVRTCKKSENGHGWYAMIRVGDALRPVSPASIKPA